MSKNLYTIYRATNKLTGKVYIGFDSAYPNRITVHKSASKKQDSKFYRAIRKYGWGSFVWEILYQSDDREYTLKTMEPFFITENNSYKDGYNSTLGGDGVFGLMLSKESREKISKGNRISKPQTRDHIQKRAEANRGKKHGPMSDEQKKKISNALRGRKKPMTEEHIAALKCHKNNSTRVKCPYCEKIGQLTNMKRWHFDRCRFNPTNDYSSDQKGEYHSECVPSEPLVPHNQS